MRSRYSRRRNDYAGSLVALGIIGIAMVIWLLSAWSLMLVVGNIHAWWSHIPSMSYGSAMGITLPTVAFAVITQVALQGLKDR
jgi:hypothetical protein